MSWRASPIVPRSRSAPRATCWRSGRTPAARSTATTRASTRTRRGSTPRRSSSATRPRSRPRGWSSRSARSARTTAACWPCIENAAGFFPQERELFEVYARYAASALDSATALMEAKRRYDHSSALLDLARALAEAGTSDEVARRLADAVPAGRRLRPRRCPALERASGRAASARRSRTATLRTGAFSSWAHPTPGRPAPEPGSTDPRSEPIFIDRRPRPPRRARRRSARPVPRPRSSCRWPHRTRCSACSR